MRIALRLYIYAATAAAKIYAKTNIRCSAHAAATFYTSAAADDDAANDENIFILYRHHKIIDIHARSGDNHFFI